MKKYDPNKFRHFENFREILSEKEEKEYNQLMNYIELYETFSTNSFMLKEFSFPKELKSKIDFVKTLATETGFKMKDLFNFLKDKKVFKLFSYVGWSIKKLAELIQTGFKVFKDLQLAIADFIAKSKIGRMTTDKIKDLSNYLDKHPKLKKYSGFAVAGLLILIWLNMSFTGDFFDDFDLSLVFQCLLGTYSLSEIFASKEGIRMLSLLALGMVTKISFPYPSTNLVKFIVAVLMTLAKTIKIRLSKGNDIEEFT